MKVRLTKDVMDAIGRLKLSRFSPAIITCSCYNSDSQNVTKPPDDTRISTIPIPPIQLCNELECDTTCTGDNRGFCTRDIKPTEAKTRCQDLTKLEQCAQKDSDCCLGNAYKMDMVCSIGGRAKSGFCQQIYANKSDEIGWAISYDHGGGLGCQGKQIFMQFLTEF